MPQGHAEEAVRAQERCWEAPPSGADDGTAGPTGLQEHIPASPPAHRDQPLLAEGWSASGKVARRDVSSGHVL